MTRIKIAVYLDLDPVPGPMYSGDSARNNVNRIINSYFGAYKPTVSVESYQTLEPKTPIENDNQVRLDRIEKKLDALMHAYSTNWGPYFRRGPIEIPEEPMPDWERELLGGAKEPGVYFRHVEGGDILAERHDGLLMGCWFENRKYGTERIAGGGDPNPDSGISSTIDDFTRWIYDMQAFDTAVKLAVEKGEAI